MTSEYPLFNHCGQNETTTLKVCEVADSRNAKKSEGGKTAEMLFQILCRYSFWTRLLNYNSLVDLIYKSLAQTIPQYHHSTSCVY